MLVGIFKNYVILVVISIMLLKGAKLYQDHFLADLCPFYTMPRNAFFFYVALYVCYEMYISSNKVNIYITDTRFYMIDLKFEYLQVFCAVLSNASLHAWQDIFKIGYVAWRLIHVY